MSNVSIDAVGPKYWSYTAEVMTACLKELSAGKPVDIPKGVLGDAQRFFELVFEVVDNSSSADPSNAFANYAIAAETIQTSQAATAQEEGEASQPTFKTLDDVNQPLRTFKGFVDKLTPEQAQLSAKKDLELAKKVLKFFEDLARKGLAESHQVALDDRHPPS